MAAGSWYGMRRPVHSETVSQVAHNSRVTLSYMNDRVFGIFTDEETARDAVDKLAASGVARSRLQVERVLASDHRGLGERGTVHSLIHAPRIEGDDNVAADAGTIILIVEMTERLEAPSPEGGFDVHDNPAIENWLVNLGATDTRVVKATPGLNL
jgi:hypothetical protein